MPGCTGGWLPPPGTVTIQASPKEKARFPGNAGRRCVLTPTPPKRFRGKKTAHVERRNEQELDSPGKQTHLLLGMFKGKNGKSQGIPATRRHLPREPSRMPPCHAAWSITMRGPGVPPWPPNQHRSSQAEAVAVVQPLSPVRLSVTPWTAARQASLSFTISWSCSNSCPLSQQRPTTDLKHPPCRKQSVFPQQQSNSHVNSG